MRHTHSRYVQVQRPSIAGLAYVSRDNRTPICRVPDRAIKGRPCMDGLL